MTKSEETMSINSICVLGLGWIGHGKTKVSALIAMYLMLFTGLAYSNTVNPQIEMYLETPAQNETYTGVAFVRGWAVAPSGIERIELYIDGVYISDVPIGESRTAVGELYPNYPDSDKSGFNMAYFYSKLDAGTHTAAVRAVDRNGQYKDAFSDFNVVRFDTNQSNNFIRDPFIVSLQSANVISDGDAIKIQGLIVDGVLYDVSVSWNTLLQGFTIDKIISHQAAENPINRSVLPEGSFGNEIYQGFDPIERLPTIDKLPRFPDIHGIYEPIKSNCTKNGSVTVCYSSTGY
jgi:hypothetical protein